METISPAIRWDPNGDNKYPKGQAVVIAGDGWAKDRICW